MSPRPATCHPDRPHAGRGLCHSCLNTLYRRRNQSRHSRKCRLCGRPFRTIWRHQKYCHDRCREIDLIRDKRPRHEDLIVTRDSATARALVESCRERKMRRITPRTSGSLILEPYWAAWKNGHLYLIRVGAPGRQTLDAMDHLAEDDT